MNTSRDHIPPLESPMPTQKDRPNDLINVETAAKMSQRSTRTIRRWFSPSVGKLTRYEGAPPEDGGPACVYVSAQDLMNLLATSRQKPRVYAPDSVTDMLTQDGVAILDKSLDTSSRTEIKLLQKQLEFATEKTELQLQMVEAEKQHLHRELLNTQNRVTELREDFLEARDRANALEAENRGLRAAQGLSWWQRMIGGPVPAKLTEA